ncbi:hypothetical protein [Mycolicibacterium porcinum]|uniref:hypothetical protein n=1 Tax=Mycolicibacterium porcinum TaxID=39693 RepID=UPI001041E7BF|nr:hypothetical protein [Mycolicibacterium porcinum]
MTEKEQSLGWMIFFDTVVSETFQMVDEARETASGDPNVYIDLLRDIYQMVEEVMPLATIEQE